MLSFIHKNLEILKKCFGTAEFEWFTKNFMKDNPNKFQAMCVRLKAYENIKSFQIENVAIKCEDSVTLLRVSIDFRLKFDQHVSEICKKASQNTLQF